MITTDEYNLTFASSQKDVDEMNSRFYGKYTFPWPPSAFEQVLDGSLESRMLAQSIGNWRTREIPKGARIWVAGCGTNQAVFTALRYPDASITATDLSVSSLATAQNSARQLGITNVDFRRQSINDASFEQEFDFVINTGVVHHNADPSIPLSRLRAALKPGGLCEFMVYNRYHRVHTTAMQKAVQLLTGQKSGTDFNAEMDVTRRILKEKIRSSLEMLLSSFREAPEAAIADACMQPVEHSYTVESLGALLQASGFEYLAPCVNQFNKVDGDSIWTMTFADGELQKSYDALPDVQRWQVTNLLMVERSPLLWFYIQRTDSGRKRKSEQTLCQEFLDMRFRPVATKKKMYIRDASHVFKPGANAFNYPAPHPVPACRRIVTAVAGSPGETMRAVLEKLAIPTDFATIQRVRQSLTTCAFPYLISQEMT